MRRILVVLAIVAIGLLAPVAPARACSCFGSTDQEAFDRVDVVFSGTVVEKRVSGGPNQSSSDPALWVFEVDEVYKGRASATQGVVSAREGASCGLELGGPGTRALVFAGNEDAREVGESAYSRLDANLCGGSRPIGDAGSDGFAFASASEPDPGEDGIVDLGTGWGWPEVAVTGVAAAAVVVALVALRRRIRRPPAPA